MPIDQRGCCEEKKEETRKEKKASQSTSLPVSHPAGPPHSPSMPKITIPSIPSVPCRKAAGSACMPHPSVSMPEMDQDVALKVLPSSAHSSPERVI